MIVTEEYEDDAGECNDTANPVQDPQAARRVLLDE